MTARSLSKSLLPFLLLPFLFVACGDDNPATTVNPPEQTAFEVLAEVGTAYINDSADAPGVIAAEALFTDGVENYTVFDIRAEDAFAMGHIAGAINATLGGIVDAVEGAGLAMDAPIVIACYTGQSAGHAKLALELLGYENVKSLLFGMASWNSMFAGSWDSNVGNALDTAETAMKGTDDLTTYEFPVLTEAKETITRDRVMAMLGEGFKGISYSDLVANGPENYFIVNYFGEADYLGAGESGVPGHIPGAYQFTPYASLGMDQMLPYLPTDMPIVVYCWTGQHSSQVTAWLNVLGYEAYSLKFGSNALFHDDLTAHKWTMNATHDYPVELGTAATDAFATLVDVATDYLNDSADCPGVISAANLMTDGIENYTIFDIRAPDAYTAGHIEGAINSSLGTIVADVAAAVSDKTAPIVIACYSGQSAGHAKFALEVLGYDNVKSLLFGMSSWNSTLSGSWDSKVGSALDTAETTNNNDALRGKPFPTLEGYDAATVVETRVGEMLADGFKAIGYSDMVTNGLENYFVVNYFGEADYLGTGDSGVPGHIPGSFQFTPYQSLGIDQLLVMLPTDMPIVIYCWTGQHSSQVTAYLNLLGYEAYSLKNGSNALFHDALTAHKWGDGAKNDYPLVTD